MNNNQNDMDRLISELQIQKSKDRKHMLRIEIAKATDRSVKKALQDILDDIERTEKRNMFFGIIALVILFLVGFYFLGVHSNKEDTKPVVKSISSETSSKKFLSEESNEKEVKEKNLSQDEVSEWVSSVWEKKHKNSPQLLDYDLKLRTDSEDNLVYINVVPTIEKNSVLGLFRINDTGKLEERNLNDWKLISKSYMDLSDVNVEKAIEDINKVNTKELTEEQAVNWVKNYRLQEGLLDEKNEIDFKTQISKEGYLQIVLYAWAPTKLFKKISSVYRINENGYLEMGSPDSFSGWQVISTEYIE